MARMYYMSLPGVGPWDAAMKEVGAQFRPYQDYLRTALNAAKRRAPVLAWRPAEPAEQTEFQRRLRERHEGRVRRARQSRRRRDRRVPKIPSGTWIVLEPPPWRLEEPDDTFEVFMDADEVFDLPGCPRERRIDRLDCDREGRAVLLDRSPEVVEPNESRKDESHPPSASSPHGPLVWLRPNTYTLSQQLRAVRDLENAPPQHLAPLVRLAVTRPAWADIELTALAEDEWVFLWADEASGALRDGTDEQRRFVEIALATPDFAVLEGPPGSGKTTAICELIVQAARRGQRVLLVASTHVAVDNVLERLIAWQDREDTTEKLVLPVRIGDEDRVTADAVVPWTYRRLRQTWRDELLDFLDSPAGVEASGAAARRMLEEALNRRGSLDDSPVTRLLLESANLICGTTIGILQHPAIKAARQGNGFEPFDIMILDEASKTTFSEFLVPARHARRWVVSGDVKQLSPYVEEVDLAENVRGLVPGAHARAAVHAFLAARTDGHRPPLPSVLVTDDDAAAELARSAAEAREVAFVDLDRCQPEDLWGVPDAVPGLLFADLVLASSEAVRRFEHRLPADVLAVAGDAPELPDWEAAGRAFVRQARQKGRYVDVPDGPPDWADEIAWRLVRSYELRQNREERDRYLGDIEALLPVTLGDDWFTWRRVKPRGPADNAESACSALRRELSTIRRVAMPSILELLQKGFERLDGWDRGVGLTDGLPSRSLDQRLVSLSYQHRMHPHIAAFSRERFYSPGQEDFAYPARSQRPPILLQDAATMEADRAWTYPRYARRALWIEVGPGRRRHRGRNVNPAEAVTLMDEIKAFTEWALANPCVDPGGRERPWEVAALTFYRGQEALLRGELQRLSGQWGNSRNFRVGRGTRAVHMTLCTVDRFQGHEADLVLLSFVKSGAVGFLNSPNRLNVAVTRARFQIVLIGHRAWFERCRSPLLQALATSEHYLGDIGWEVSR